MKIYVYAICKNEEKFVTRFMESASEADGVFVLDTGSQDNSVELLKKHGATVVEKIIKPWRFDVARNESLKLVPLDAALCVCVDLDEVLEKGWRDKLEKSYVPRTKQVKYKYVWSHEADGSDGYVFWSEKIHARENFSWVNPVHEVLKYSGKDYSYQFVDIRVDHFADEKKSRDGYLPLLELAVKEDPENDRNMHYLGREYMYRGSYHKAIETLKKHLTLKSATWKDERSASFRFIANCYDKLCDFSSAEKYYFKAIAEAPYLREPFIYLAEFYYKRENYLGALFACERALVIKNRSLSYINEPKCYNELPYDLASIACFNLGLYKKSLEYINLALNIKPDNERLKNNKKLILDKLTLN